MSDSRVIVSALLEQDEPAKDWIMRQNIKRVPDWVEDVVFIQGEEADEPLRILDEQGVNEAVNYMAQWHFPGQHQTRRELSAGSADHQQVVDVDGDHSYVLTWNPRLGYIGLEFVKWKYSDAPYSDDL